MQVFTIGVYGYTRETFLAALKDAGIDVLIDIRRRRGVRGPDYTFANSQRLQEEMAELGIRYIHEIALAPGEDIVHQQIAHDTEHGGSIRKRTELLPSFREAYHRTVLDHFGFAAFFADNHIQNGNICLMCVERTAEACHRGMVAEKLHELYGWPVTNLEPPE